MEDSLVMQIAFIRELINKERSKCNVCSQFKTLEYGVTDTRGNISFSICPECRDKLSSGGERKESA